MNADNTNQPPSFRDVALSCASDVVRGGARAGLAIAAVVAIITALWFGVPVAADHLYQFVTGGGVAPWRNVLLTFPLAALYPWCACVAGKLPDRSAVVAAMWSVYAAAVVVHGTCARGFLTTLSYAYESAYTKNAMPPYEYVALICCAVLSVLILMGAVFFGITEMEPAEGRAPAASDADAT